MDRWHPYAYFYRTPLLPDRFFPIVTWARSERAAVICTQIAGNLALHRLGVGS